MKDRVHDVVRKSSDGRPTNLEVATDARDERTQSWPAGHKPDRCLDRPDERLAEPRILALVPGREVGKLGRSLSREADLQTQRESRLRT